MATAQQRFFLQDWYDEAKAVSDQTGVPILFILGQWALETGFGKHFAGSYNPGNVQGANPKPYNYNSQMQGAMEYAKVINNNRYDLARQADTPLEFGQALKMGGYATDPDYANKVAATIQTVNNFMGLESYDGFGNSGETPEIINEHGQAPEGLNPLQWVKDKGLNVVFLAVGVLGLAFMAWKYAPSSEAE